MLLAMCSCSLCLSLVVMVLLVIVLRLCPFVRSSCVSCLFDWLRMTSRLSDQRRLLSVLPKAIPHDRNWEIGPM